MSWCLCVLTLFSGCAPTQPFFFKEDGNLSHYMDVATTIEYPDVSTPPIDDVAGAQAPLTLANAENFVIWDLTLEEVTRRTLENSQVIRQLGGRVSDFGQNISSTTPQSLTGQGGAADNAVTSFNPALVESGYGGGTGSPFSGTGVEAALSEFDAQLDSSLSWANNDRPQNFGLAQVANLFAPQFRQDQGRGTIGVTKQTPVGTTFELRNNYVYDQNNNGSRIAPSDWNVNVEAAFTQPFLQGAGLQYNEIAGPRTFQEANGGFADQIDGVLISRLRYDISLTDFENGVRNLMRDVEDAYWELYFAYRDLDARKIGRDSALATWRRVKTLERAGSVGGEANAEAQARSQYYLFRAQVETALTNVFRVENRLRYLMGIAVSDGRLIRPIDEPTVAQVHFDWPTIHAEALASRVELRRGRWQIKRRELELIAARNQMLPRLDAVGRYRWLGAGDELIDSHGTGIPPFAPNSNAFETLTSGDYQEWELALQFTMPIGFRRAMTGVRHHQLLLARERAVVQEMELEVSHQLGDAVRDVDLNYGTAQTYFNRRQAADDEVEAVEVLYDVGQIVIDRVLDAQARQAEAESQYYRSLVDYNRAIMRLHYAKGSLLEYNGVYLAEGPWPGKAYFDALRRARTRDAGLYMNYGYTRPSVLSRGPHPQVNGASAGVLPSPTPTPAVANPLENQGPGAGAAPPEPVPTPPSDPVSLVPLGAVNMVEFMQPLPAVAEVGGLESEVQLPAAQQAWTSGGMPAAAPGGTTPTTSPAVAPPSVPLTLPPGVMPSPGQTPAPAKAPPTPLPSDAAASVPALPPNPFLSSRTTATPTPAYESQADHAAVEVAAGAAGG
jgi:outer membrane protein TolC